MEKNQAFILLQSVLRIMAANRQRIPVMFMRAFGRELSISGGGLTFRRTDVPVPMLSVGRWRFECERFVDGLYLRLNSREWFIWM